MDGRRLVSTRQYLFDVAWSPSGKHLAIRRSDGDGDNASDLVVVHLTDGHVVELGQAATAATWSPDGTQFAYVTGSWPGLLVTVEPNGDVIHELDEIRTVNNDAAWSPDGRSIAYLQHSSGILGTSIASVSPTGGDLRALTPRDGSLHSDPVWSPDSRRLVFSVLSGDASLYVVHTSGGRAQFVAAPGRLPAWSPDGRWLVFVGSGNDIYLARPGRA